MLVAFRLAGLSALQAYCAGVCVGAQKSPCGNGRKDGSAIIGLISGARRRWRREGSLIAQVAILPAVIRTSLPVMLRSSTLDRRGRAGTPSGWVSMTLWPWSAIFYSLPRRRCYARHGVDRPASRHAGLRSCFHVLLSAAWKRGHAQANDRHSSRVFAMPPRGFARTTRNG
jgi:hypothetical protein